jgi:hypothetical protein
MRVGKRTPDGARVPGSVVVAHVICSGIIIRGSDRNGYFVRVAQDGHQVLASRAEIHPITRGPFIEPKGVACLALCVKCEHSAADPDAHYPEPVQVEGKTTPP